MTRVYRGYRCKGDREEVIQRITKWVNELTVRDRVPRVCTERSVGRGPREFYLFVAFEQEENEPLEDRVAKFFDFIQTQPPRLGKPIGDFQRQEISKFVGQDLHFEEFSRRLRYNPLVVPDAGDPFDKEGDEGLSLDELELTQQCDRLLLWMSAHAEGAFATLDSARRALRIGMDTRSVLRTLRLLGHCESSRDGSRWSMAPSTVIQVDEGCIVLAGPRDESLIQELRQRFRDKTEQVPQPSGAGPSAFRIRTDDPGDLSQLGVAVERHADRALARALPSIDHWAKALESVPIDLGSFTLQRLSGDNFDDVGAFRGEPGFYRIQRTGTNARASYLYYAPELGWRRGEWAGLRFLARLREFGPAPCTFDARKYRLFVPLEWRWPEIYERALVLSSGLLPTREDNGNGSWLVYGSIEQELLELLQPRLELEVQDA
ncbi:hypothetical protein [Tepidiforma sp.]|uniref:hypothetical protein n=1 Tax=Tepidiforma sp. TaxID=2682230 RepID=UPI002ADD7643|nr:hypothetical protein [Tepidiforma sp.]